VVVTPFKYRAAFKVLEFQRSENSSRRASGRLEPPEKRGTLELRDGGTRGICKDICGSGK
jgi:hypothetical protein